MKDTEQRKEQMQANGAQEELVARERQNLRSAEELQRHLLEAKRRTTEAEEK